LILHHTIDLQTLPAGEVCIGILSLFALAFIAGGMNFLYQIEKLPLMLAILIHGGVLYLSYLGTYLLNGWLDRGLMPILIFTGIFLLGYLVIWAIIYAVNKKNTDKINQLLKDKQQVE
jgi:cytochrome c oxidase assembly factor CtaG